MIIVKVFQFWETVRYCLYEKKKTELDKQCNILSHNKAWEN